jgi:hypothetical protein
MQNTCYIEAKQIGDSWKIADFSKKVFGIIIVIESTCDCTMNYY